VPRTGVPHSPRFPAAPAPERGSGRPRRSRSARGRRALAALASVLALFAPSGLGSSAALAGGPSEVRSGSTEEREYPVKAAFLLHFIRYTTWPKASFADDSSPIVVTVVGKDPFGEVLESTFRDEEAHGRKIRVARSQAVPAELGGHVVFCAELSKVQREEVLAKCAKRPLLVVGETRDFALEGASINFYLQDKKTRFEINPDAVAAAGLELSPAVLKLARIVRTQKGGG